MQTLLAALGLIFLAEGLLLALAPGLLDRALAVLSAMSSDQRRTAGLTAAIGGAALLWLARGLG